jgi:hypothetical protein
VTLPFYSRVITWLGRRQAAAHRVEETARRAETRLQFVESVVAEQQRRASDPTVNIIYDRLTRAGAGAGKGVHRHG